MWSFELRRIKGSYFHNKEGLFCVDKGSTLKIQYFGALDKKYRITPIYFLLNLFLKLTYD